MEKVQAWLQENLGIILGVCVGVAVIEVRPHPSRAPDSPLPARALPEAEACGASGREPLEALWPSPAWLCDFSQLLSLAGLHCSACPAWGL